MALFDPYHKWLGIPPADQPANHYRLLGLNLFESDPDVIDVATEQRVVYLRQCATGQHIAESQKLLNEVAAARLCLLNVEIKRLYDQRLRQSLAATQVPAQSTGPASAPVMMPWETPSDEQPEAVQAVDVQLPKRGERVARKNSPSAPVAFTGKRIAVASGLFVAVVLGFVLMRGGSDTTKPASDDQKTASTTADARHKDENKAKPTETASNTSTKSTTGSTPKRSVAESPASPLTIPNAKSKESNQEASRADVDRLQGRWECVFEESSGVENTAAELAAMKKIMIVSGNQFSVQRVINGVAGEYRGTFSLGWDGEKRLFDLAGTGPNGKHVEWLGLCEFDGEVFKVCYRVRPENGPSSDRATTFGTWANSSRVFNKFRRVSEPAETRKGVATSDVPRPMAIGFESRGSGVRQAMLASGGGTAETERAVAAALGWIARHQSPDGSWNCKHFSKQCTDPSCQRHVSKLDPKSATAQEYPTAATAFGLLPYLAAGMTPESEGPYQDVIRKGLQWLTTNQDPKTGRLGPGNMYEHGLGTIAICEAYGLSKDAKLRPLAQAAVRFTEDAQNDVSGGWHYVANPPTDGDTSVLGWQFMSLRSAQMAGLPVNPQTLEKAQRYLRTVARGKSGGLSAYQTSTPPTPAMTAIGLLCRQYDGMRRSDPAMIEGMNYLLANPPHSAKNCYYWFYATQVIHNLAGPEWQDWNDRARELWIATQIKEGCAAGSWSVEGHGDVAGPLMITSLNALNLEVYYRNRPLYQAVDPELDSEKPKTDEPETVKPTETKKPDPATLIKTKLEKAKSEYESDLNKVRTKMLAALERKEADARKDGNKKLVDQIEAERKTLDELQLLPLSIPTREYEIGIGKAREEMKTAYNAAIKDFTRQRFDVEASSREKELTLFLAEEFNFQGRWKILHRKSGWMGERVVTRDRVDGIPPRADEKHTWKRDGTSLRVLFEGGGWEQLTIDPKNPNRLNGNTATQGIQWDRVIAPQKKK